MKGIGIGGAQPAHHASVPVPLENEGAGLLRDRARQNWQPRISLENILPRFQFPPVLVRENLISIFIAKLSQASGPFGCVSRCFANLRARNHSPLVRKKETKHAGARATA